MTPHLDSNTTTDIEIFKKTGSNLYIYMGVEARDLYIDEAHMALDIFHFVVFFFLSAECILPQSYLPRNNVICRIVCRFMSKKITNCLTSNPGND